LLCTLLLCTFVAATHARAARAASGGSSATAKGKGKGKSKRTHKPVRLPSTDMGRAIFAYEAMQKRFYVGGSGLYSGAPYSFLWPFSQAFAATVSLAWMPGEQAQLARDLHVRLYGLTRYWNYPGQATVIGLFPPSTLPSYNGSVVAGPGVASDSFYDDNEWVGIELVRLYELDHQAALLERAEQVMAFAMAGWQTNPGLACPGGIPFSTNVVNADRNTVTNAPAVELALQLYRVTGQNSYLQFAQTAYEWVRACLLQASNLYADHIRTRGVVGEALWSYNQGTMIGAGVLLYQLSGNSAYLYQGRQTAKAALAYFTPTRLYGENPFFVSVYFRNLLYLDSVTHDPPGAKLVQEYVDHYWSEIRSANQLFVGGSPPAASLLVQAALVQDYALLSELPTSYF
jgi:hypothetical protein